jgi:hypothetical protein
LIDLLIASAAYPGAIAPMIVGASASSSTATRSSPPSPQIRIRRARPLGGLVSLIVFLSNAASSLRFERPPKTDA